MKKGIVLIWTLFVLLCLIGKTDARIWYVHPDSTLNAIQTGLNSCSSNDTVLVAPGIYQENIFWSLLNGIKLFGEYGADSTIIDGNSFSCVIYFSGMANIDTTTIIKGFTIQNGGSVPNGGGICLINSSPKIENNIDTKNEMLAKVVLEKRRIERSLWRPEPSPQTEIIRLPTIQHPLIKSNAIFIVKNQVKFFSLSHSVILDH